MSKPCRQGIECQVCDRLVRFKSSEELARKIANWVQYAYSLTGLEVHVLTCPDCARLDPSSIMVRRTDRIREGRDLNFH